MGGNGPLRMSQGASISEKNISVVFDIGRGAFSRHIGLRNFASSLLRAVDGLSNWAIKSEDERAVSLEKRPPGMLLTSLSVLLAATSALAASFSVIVNGSASHGIPSTLCMWIVLTAEFHRSPLHFLGGYMFEVPSLFLYE